MCRCVLCDFVDPKEVVTHVRDEHRGGIERYLLFFPFIPVVNAKLLKACNEFVRTGNRDSSIDGLTDDEIRTVVETAERQKVERSRVVETPDF